MTTPPAAAITLLLALASPIAVTGLAADTGCRTLHVAAATTPSEPSAVLDCVGDESRPPLAEMVLAHRWPGHDGIDDQPSDGGATRTSGDRPIDDVARSAPEPARTHDQAADAGGLLRLVAAHSTEPSADVQLARLASDAAQDGTLPGGHDHLLLLLALLAVPFATSLLGSLVFAALSWRRQALIASVRRPALAAPNVDHEQRSRLLLHTASVLWRNAESAVLQLDAGLPLRTLLLDELKLIARRLAANPTVQSIGQGALTTGHPDGYWRTLSQGLNRTVRDLQRICAVAEAGRASFGDRSNEPRLPRTMEEAYFVLGANPGVESETLQRLVRALRQCWHPDLAQSDIDRRYREARIRQINVANDIIRAESGEPVPLRQAS